MRSHIITSTLPPLELSSQWLLSSYLTNRSNPKLTGELAQAGYRVFNAQAVSEALYFCETENVDAVVIAPDVEDADVVEAQMRRITLKLKPEATLRELMVGS